MQELSSPRHAPGRTYAVLARVSPGYPPCMGRLLTCYAPVRHWAPPEGRTPFDLHVLSAPPAFVLSQDQTLHELNSSLEQTLLRLFGIRVVWFPYNRHAEDTMPPPATRAGCATGRTIQALPNTLIVKCLADHVRFFLHGDSAGFTRSVASRSPYVWRVLQSNRAGLLRQPLGRRCFLDFPRGVPSVNSLNLNHLTRSVKGRIHPFRRRRPNTERLSDSPKG